MKVRFLQTVVLTKTNFDGTTEKVTKLCNKNVIVSKVVKTEDPEYFDIYFEDGYIKDVNRAILSVYGPIEPYEESNE